MATTPIIASAAASIARVSEMEACRRLCIAVLAGAAIGFERTILYVQERGQRRHNMARTMALVSLGSATFTLASLAGLPYSDPARVVATIVSGVGFLGAGVITQPSLLAYKEARGQDADMDNLVYAKEQETKVKAEQDAKARKAEKERRKLMDGKEAAASSENGASSSVLPLLDAVPLTHPSQLFRISDLFGRRRAFPPAEEGGG